MAARGGRRSPTLDSSRDDGFTLVEVILAMFIIIAVMTSLLGVLVSSLSTIAQARQRQTATALATQAIEELRALPYDVVTVADSAYSPAAGATYAQLVGTSYVFKGSLVTGIGVDEPLIVNRRSPLVEDHTVDGIVYRVQTYVTRAAVAAGAQQAFNLTALVSWSSTVSQGTRLTAQRSVTYSPAGCLSTAQSPFAAPCQAYFTANAGQARGGITITNPADSNLPVEGFADGAGRQLQLTLAHHSSNLLVEQTASANAGVNTSGSRYVGGLLDPPTIGASGGLGASAQVDSDPSTEPALVAPPVSTPGQTSSAQSLTGTAGAVLATPSTADDGSARGGIEADAGLCIGVSGSPLVTGPAGALRPCASGEIRPSGTAGSVTYRPLAAHGFNQTSVSIATVVPTGSSLRTVSALLAAGNPGVACTAGAGTPGIHGCAFAAATREIAASQFGVPNPGATVPAGFDARGLVTLSGLSESVRVEEGTSAREPLYARQGTLEFWNGTDYTTVDLSGWADPAVGSPSQSWAIPETEVVYAGGGSATLTMRFVDASVTVQRPQVTWTPAVRTGNVVTDCQAEACVSQLNGGHAVIVTFTVAIYRNAEPDPIGLFGVSASLGGLVGQASYKAAADA